jgi:Xaa-Pro aminopeptidase
MSPPSDATDFAAILRRAGVTRPIEEVHDILAGIAAAPRPRSDDAWLSLIVDAPSPELRAALIAWRDRLTPPESFGRAGPERLALLRAELARRGLDGFIVPRADEHQGEYVAPYAMRLAWVTGFTGSAGVAVVLAERAALFVDGRYTLQARHEVDPALFETCHLVEQPPERWLSEMLPAGAKLGYDPWLHSVAGVERLRAGCDKAGASLVACADNPVDAVWSDQPPRPLAPVEPLSVRFTGCPGDDKREDAARALAADKVAAAVLTAPDSIAWLLNVRGGDVAYTPLPLSFAILHDDARVEWFIDPRKLVPGLREQLGDAVTVLPPNAVGPALDRLAGQSVRVDAGTLPAWIAERLQCNDARLNKGLDPCALAKACKNPVELAGIRAAHRRDGAAMARFLAWLAREAPAGQLREIAVSDRLEAFRAAGEHFEGLSFPTISGAGANGAIVHYHASPASERTLEPGNLYLVDSGAQYRDGTTDITRTVAIGSPSAEHRHRFTLVLKGHIAVASTPFPIGTTGSQLDALARRALWMEGLDYDHGTGHGVGHFLSVHEGPQRISKAGNPQELKPGMILSIEPGYYKPGAYGIRIENLAAVEEIDLPAAERPMLGFEPLTLAPIDLALVERSLLSDQEAAWLNAYHARVRTEISPLVDAETARWLEQATWAV